MTTRELDMTNVFARRRAALFEFFGLVGHKDPVLVLTANFEQDTERFRQDSTFYYLTGVSEPGAIMVCSKEGAILYVPRYATLRERWVEEVITPSKEMSQLLGLTDIRYLGAARPGYTSYPYFDKSWYEHLIDDLSQHVLLQKPVCLVQGQHSTGGLHQRYLYENLMRYFAKYAQQFYDDSHLIAALRTTKQEEEIHLIAKAVAITIQAQLAGIEAIVPGRKEAEVQAVIDGVFTVLGAARPAFPSIVASGKNSTVLHYTGRQSTMQDGDLVVVDIGAEFGCYAADITRTYPVNGVFSARQKEVYEVVLATQTYVAKHARPGMFLNNPAEPAASLHHLALDFLTQQGYRQYFPHGIGHYLGLEVHDVGDPTKPLEPGDVFTIEPGIYIPEESLGIRIEDDFVITDDGCWCLSEDLPRSVQEIEQLMSLAAAEKINE